MHAKYLCYTLTAAKLFLKVRNFLKMQERIAIKASLRCLDGVIIEWIENECFS